MTSAPAELGERLIIGHMEDSIRPGAVRLRSAEESRNVHQSMTLLDAIAEYGFDACIGGARRDEEKARAKERIFSFPRRVRPVGSEESAAGIVEPLQHRVHKGENIPRVSDQQLDRAGCLAVHRPRKTGGTVDLLRASA